MDQTLVEKIIAGRAGRAEVRPGDFIPVSPDVIAMNEARAARVLEQCQTLPADMRAPADPSRVAIWIDRVAATPRLAVDRRRVQDFAESHRIENFFPLGRGGLAEAEVCDRGFALPGRILLTGDHGAAGLGALGALGLAAGETELALALASGRTWISVPASVRLRITGSPGRWCGGRDVMLYVLSVVERSFFDRLPIALELWGPAVERMDVIDRIEMCDLAVNAGGAEVALCAADEKTLTWLRARSSAVPPPILPDAEAIYADAQGVDIDGIEPRVAVPGDPFHSVPLSELPEIELDQVVIGGPTGGRIEELRVAASLLKEHAVASRVRLIIIPASQRAYLHAIAEGLVGAFVRSGAVVAPPTGGLWDCSDGSSGTLAAGERCLATTTANYPGWEGDPTAEIYLGSAAVAAASAVMGRIAHPDEVLRSKREAV